jgi:hypothetical protein
VSEPQGGDAQQLPRDTTPTWEMELLLSGATVFGLLQLPDALLAASEPVLSRLGGGVAMVTGILQMYVGAAVYVLLATFILHLVIRGFWIALMGLRSVFPEGPDFERVRGGPIAREVTRRVTPRVEVEIGRLDNLATICFMFGAITIFGVLMPGLLVLPALAVTWLWPQVQVGPLMTAILALFIGPMMLAGLIDSWFGKRLDREGWLAKSLVRVLTLYQRGLQPGFLNVLTTTLMSRFGVSRFMFIYMGALLAVLLGFSAYTVMRGNGVAIGDYTAVPADIERGWAVLPEHYRDQRREGDRLRRVPYLDSLQLKGDWLRLVVPYHPTRHEAEIALHCPDVWATLPLSKTLEPGPADAAYRALLGCYRDLAAIRIDGRRVDVLPDIVVLPDTRMRGLLFMIDARTLAPGRHVLESAQLPDRRKKDAGKVPASYRIPFWK